nr:hypothetical protein CFP56_46660 [Quercus suber]
MQVNAGVSFLSRRLCTSRSGVPKPPCSGAGRDSSNLSSTAIVGLRPVNLRKYAKLLFWKVVPFKKANFVSFLLPLIHSLLCTTLSTYSHILHYTPQLKYESWVVKTSDQQATRDLIGQFQAGGPSVPPSLSASDPKGYCTSILQRLSLAQILPSYATVSSTSSLCLRKSLPKMSHRSVPHAVTRCAGIRP